MPVFRGRSRAGTAGVDSGPWYPEFFRRPLVDDCCADAAASDTANPSFCEHFHCSGSPSRVGSIPSESVKFDVSSTNDGSASWQGISRSVAPECNCSAPIQSAAFPVAWSFRVMLLLLLRPSRSLLSPRYQRHLQFCPMRNLAPIATLELAHDLRHEILRVAAHCGWSNLVHRLPRGCVVLIYCIPRSLVRFGLATPQRAVVGPWAAD